MLINACCTQLSHVKSGVTEQNPTKIFISDLDRSWPLLKRPSAFKSSNTFWNVRATTEDGQADFHLVEIERYKIEPRNIWSYRTESYHIFARCSRIIAAVLYVPMMDPVPYFPICQETLPWQPNNVAVMKANGYYVHSLHVC